MKIQQVDFYIHLKEKYKDILFLSIFKYII